MKEIIVYRNPLEANLYHTLDNLPIEAWYVILGILVIVFVWAFLKSK